MNWTMTLMICYAPLLVMYCREILGEAVKSQLNINRNKELINNFAQLSVNKNIISPSSKQMEANQKAKNMFKNHLRKTWIMDFIGILINLLFIPTGVFLFLYLLAQRLDGQNEVSFFVLMIPLWVIAIPIFAYIILNGLAAQNTRINNVEKVFLSLFVPMGFLISLILLMWYIESGKWKEKEKLLRILFIPHLLSLMALYLYLRCLVRQVKVHDI